MTKNPFDQFSKQFFKEFLSSYGTVRINEEIPGEPRFVDIWFIPANQPNADLSDLGILGRIAETPCLLEPFRNQPNKREVHSCLFKLYHLEAEIIRDANREEDTISDSELPQLWIITSSCTDNFLNQLPATPDKAWPTGIYFIGQILKVAVIVINRLLENPDTLYLRLLGKGLTQKRAIDEVLALSKQDSTRARLLKLLSTWKITIEVNGEINVEDREVIMNLSQAYLEWEQETERRGIEQGKEVGQRELIENLLVARFGQQDSELMAIVQPILNLPPSEYAALLLQLSNLSRQDLLARFRNE